MMKLLALTLIATTCLGQQVPVRELKWDYSEWQPILRPCPTCRQSRILQATPARVSPVSIAKSPVQASQGTPPVLNTQSNSETKPSKSIKPNQIKAPLVPSQPPPPISEDTSSVVQLQPVFQTSLPKRLKFNPTKFPLPPSQPPRTLAITFPPKVITGSPISPAVANTAGGEVRLVYLPEGSIQQLSSANAARVIPTSRAPGQIQQGIDTIPPLLAPNVIQSVDFSDKQKRDHEGRIITGGATNALPMSLITSRGHENDAREKLKLLEVALNSPIEQENGKLPRVFIAPSHVPPPPGYVKIPLVPQGNSESPVNKEEPLPTTFLTPDSRSPPPGFVKFDLPSTVSQLSRDIPVVVPNSQVEPNGLFNRPSFSPTPGPVRPDAALNFQAQDVRTGKNIKNNLPQIQVVSKGEAKSTVTPKSATPKTVTKQNPHFAPQNFIAPTERPFPVQQSIGPIPQQPNFRPIPQQPTSHLLPKQPSPPFPQNNIQTQFFPPRQPPTFQQQFLNPSQQKPFAQRPGQPIISVFPGQPVVQAGKPFSQNNQPILQNSQTFPRPGQPFQPAGQQIPVTPRPSQQFHRPNTQFTRPGQDVQRPIQSFSQGSQTNQHFPQQGQPILQPGQTFPRIIQHFQQSNPNIPQPGQRPVNSIQNPNIPQPGQRPVNPNQSIFRSPNTHVQSDFPDIQAPLLGQTENLEPQTTLQVSQPTTPVVPHSTPFPSSLAPVPTTPRPIPNSAAQFSPRPQLITSFPFSNSPTPPPFISSSPSSITVNQGPRFPPRPSFFSTPNPLSLTPSSPSSPSSFSSASFPTSSNPPARPAPASPFTPTTPRPTFAPTQRPTFSTTQRPQFATNTRPQFSTTTRPRFFTTPRPQSVTTPRPQFVTTPRPILTSPQSFAPTSRPFSSSPRPFPSTPLRPQPVTFTPQPPIEVSTPRSLIQGSLSFEDSSSEFSTSVPEEIVNQDIPDFQEPQITTLEDNEALQIQTLSTTGRPPVPSFEGLTVRIPSFQRPQTATITRFPGPQSPRIPSFQRPTSRTPLRESSEEVQDPVRPQRLPIFPRFQKPRITTVSPEDEEQEQFTVSDIDQPIPTTVSVLQTTPSPPKTTTVKVTTFKPKFSFNRGNRRPIIRRKPRPTEEGKKDVGEKKAEVSTLFPPFSVARTLNPLRNEKEAEESSVPGRKGITLPPAGAFGRRLRPRTKAPTSRSNDDDRVSSSPSGLRSRGLVGNRARELPDWLKARRRNRGRFRGQSSTTENISVADPILEEDVPIDILENNGFSGAESTLVVFSSPPENVVVHSAINQENENPHGKDEEDDVVEDEVEEVILTKTASGEEFIIISHGKSEQEDTESQFENTPNEEKINASSILSEASEEALAEPYAPESSNEDYSYEPSEEALSEPEPEPEPSNKYVDEYDEYDEDDIKDTSETKDTHDQPQMQSPSFPNPQLSQNTSTSTSSNPHPLAKVPENPSVENFKPYPVDTKVDYLLDEVDDGSERYVNSESSDKGEAVVNLPLDKETGEQKLNDTEIDFKIDSDSIPKVDSFSHENNSSKINHETHEIGGEGEGDAEGGKDGESQDYGEDSYQEYKPESPRILSLFPNDYFTALSPGELENYDYYEYDSYVDEDYTEESVDQNFGGSSAQVVFAVPVTEYYPEETTPEAADVAIVHDEPIDTTDLDNVVMTTTEDAMSMTTEVMESVSEDDIVATEMPLELDVEPVTDSLFGFNEIIVEDFETTTIIPEEEEIEEVILTTLNPLQSITTPITTPPPTTTAADIATTSTPFSFPSSLSSTITTLSTTASSTPTTYPVNSTSSATTPSPTTSSAAVESSTTPSATASSTTKARPASIRPLYARLQSAGKKAAEIANKKLARAPRIIGQSTVTEIRSSDPVICFHDNQCVRARGQRRRRSYTP